MLSKIDLFNARNNSENYDVIIEDNPVRTVVRCGTYTDTVTTTAGDTISDCVLGVLVFEDGKVISSPSATFVSCVESLSDIMDDSDGTPVKVSLGYGESSKGNFKRFGLVN